VKSALERLGVKTAAAVGTMGCTLLFIGLGILSAPNVGPDWLNAWANWLDQALLPLVLMPVLLFASDAAAKIIQQLIEDTHNRAVEMHERTLAIADALHIHLTGESHPATKQD
jgi:hypothetical protein